MQVGWCLLCLQLSGYICSTCSGGRSTNRVQPRLTGATWPCCAEVTVMSGRGSRPVRGGVVEGGGS